jgi:hypothetical protein
MLRVLGGNESLRLNFDSPFGPFVVILVRVDTQSA